MDERNSIQNPPHEEICFVPLFLYLPYFLFNIDPFSKVPQSYGNHRKESKIPHFCKEIEILEIYAFSRVVYDFVQSKRIIFVSSFERYIFSSIFHSFVQISYFDGPRCQYEISNSRNYAKQKINEIKDLYNARLTK